MIQHRKTSSHSDGISRKCSGLINRPNGRNMVHNFLFSSISSYRHTSTDNFTHGSKIRRHAKKLLCTPYSQPEPGHYLIENQYDAFLVSNLPKSFQKPFLGLY